MMDFIPRPFRLQVEDYEAEEGAPPEIVGWGMTLPDGSAIAIDNDPGHTPMLAICSGPAGAAYVFRADFVWLTDPGPSKSPVDNAA